MIRLEIQRNPKWLDLGRGVKVKVLPPLTSIATQVWREMADRGAFDDDSDVDAGLIEAKAWAKRVIVEWEGVGDIEGNAIESPTEETVDALIDVPWVYLAFRAMYVAQIHAVEEEKKD